MALTLLVSTSSGSLFGFDEQLKDDTISWRILPITSKNLHMRIDFLERCWDNLSLVSSGDNCPLYHRGAPHSIYAIDTINNQFAVYRITFLRKGCFYKVQPRHISEGVGLELFKLIQNTTGIERPHGYIHREESPVSFYTWILKAGATFTYKAYNDISMIAATERPCIFVSSRVTDEMLVKACHEILWTDVFKQLGTPVENGTEYDADTIEHCKKAFENWHKSAQEVLSKQDNTSNLVLCIA